MRQTSFLCVLAILSFFFELNARDFYLLFWGIIFFSFICSFIYFVCSEDTSPLLRLVKCKSQLCLTLCNPTDCSPLGFSVHGDFQTRILEWVAGSSFRGASQPKGQTQVSRIADRLFTI